MCPGRESCLCSDPTSGQVLRPFLSPKLVSLGRNPKLTRQKRILVPKEEDPCPHCDPHLLFSLISLGHLAGLSKFCLTPLRWRFLTSSNTPFAAGLLRKTCGLCSINLNSDHPDAWRSELCTSSARAVQCLLEQCYRHSKICGAFTHSQELLQTSAGLTSGPIFNTVCDHS